MPEPDDTCPGCGWTLLMQDYCPRCGDRASACWKCGGAGKYCRECGEAEGACSCTPGDDDLTKCGQCGPDA